MARKANLDLGSARLDLDPMSSAKGNRDQNSNEGDCGGSCDTAHPRALIRKRSATTNLLWS
jgi:hypothetical protein